MKNQLICVMSLSALLACEEQEKPAAAAAQPAVSALKPAEAAPATPQTSADEPETPTRPASISTELTDERRTKLETAYPKAKGFVVAKDVEQELKDNKAVKEEANAVKAFDAKVKGKWVLFAGTMVNLTAKGFDLAIVYTPQLPNDPMGMSRQFFTVTFSDVEGYDESKFKAGSTVVVLAQYTGNKQASPGYEVVDAGHWQ